MTVFYSTIDRSIRRGTYDKNLEIRDYAATALSATTSSTPIELPLNKTKSYKICFSIAAHTDYEADTKTWTLTFEVCDTVAGSYATVATVAPVGTALEGEIPLTDAQVQAIKAGASFIRVTATKLSTPGDLTFGAWIVPN
jgi:hypothetical protein